MTEWKYEAAYDLGWNATRRFCSTQREVDLSYSVARLVWWTVMRWILRMWNRLEIRGLEHLPAQPPVVLAANHASHLDALVLAVALPLRWRDQLSPIAAGDYFFSSSTKAGFSAVVLNALPVWRGCHSQLHALVQLRQRLLNRAAVYLIFPEGTRSRDGQMQGFKPGFGLLVAGTKVPVVPCYVGGTFAAMPPHHSTWRAAPISLDIGCPKTFESVPNTGAGWEQIAAATRAEIVALHRNREMVKARSACSCRSGS